ncbi:hypothetical protein BCR44DRAFT_1436963 [Catenaria anguillulae PL171]|uniref:Uncharacterized protein n=1 Tax=Catenaria anguillulae PL171 TaxID=765915 RepID=A0A1Y2HK03_9FUNG|nr:hypothetical protein BCR44DRAFT_1436963 [Catenaria anguillulae PL171]
MQRTSFQRPTKVKNKTPAEIQITAEQILRESHDRAEPLYTRPKQQITTRTSCKTTASTAANGSKTPCAATAITLACTCNMRLGRVAGRARPCSVRVRARARGRGPQPEYLDQVCRNGDAQQKHQLGPQLVGQGSHAVAARRPVLVQVCVHGGNAQPACKGAPDLRAVDDVEARRAAWESYIAFEVRYREVQRARLLYRRMVECHPDPKNWITYARFEEAQSDLAAARSVFEQAVAYLGDTHASPELFMAFAKFETRQGELDRARAIYTYALQTLPKSAADDLYRAYTQFEKMHGDRKSIEHAVASKRRHIYLDEIKANPHNVDAWMDLVRLEEDSGDLAATRDTYERAVANVPPVQVDSDMGAGGTGGGAAAKRLWRRYIYLWLQYAAFEEAKAHDVDRARAVYTTALDTVPHKHFTFAKLWIQYAKFMIRQRDLPGARKLLGFALGIAPKPSLFKGYIDIEMQLREFERVRVLYNKFIEFNAALVTTWVKYAELETMLGDVERARGIYELAVAQEVLDVPEVIWQAYIEFECDLGEWDNARELYERMLQRTIHVKVWVQFAKFEVRAEQFDSVQERATRARAIFQRGYKALKEQGLNEERLLLLQSWQQFEREFGAVQDLTAVTKMFPKVTTRRRRVGETGGVSEQQQPHMTEEYLEYAWPDDEVQKPSLKLLEKAHAWKAKLAARTAQQEALQKASARAASAPIGEEGSEQDGSQDEDDMDVDREDTSMLPDHDEQEERE